MASQGRIISKLPGTGTSIFSVMTKMAEKFNAINLAQGFPDFNCSPELISLVNNYMKNGKNQYAPMKGVMELRKEISNKISSLHHRYYNPESEIIITAGATQAIFTAISALIRKDDEVIIIEPAYDSYAPSVYSNGGKVRFVSMDSDFKIDWNKVKESISKKTKLLILNSPHNPTGYVISDADIKILEEIVAKNDLFILSDEVYEHIVFEGTKHKSLASSEIISNRAFIISSFGKTYHTTGWKLGYCAAPEYLINEFSKLHQFIVFSVNTPIQYAFSDYLKNPDHYLNLNSFYQKKRDLFLNALKGTAFKFIKTNSTYFQLLDYSEISNKNDMEFVNFLAEKIGIAAIPLSPFYNEGSKNKLIRICFAKEENVLEEAAKRFSKLT